MKGPPLGPGWEDITWPDQVAPRGRRAPSTLKVKPQTSNLTCSQHKTPKRHWDIAPILLNLLQDRTDRVVRGIGPEHKPLVRIQEVQAERLE